MKVAKVRVGDKHTIINYEKGGICSLPNNHAISVFHADMDLVIAAKDLQEGSLILSFFPEEKNEKLS